MANDINNGAEQVQRKHIEAYLKDWVNSSQNPHFAVLLEGKWGSGKTYFIKELLEKKGSFTQKKIIYISLFGIDSIQDFERNLFYAALSKGKEKFYQSINLMGSATFGAMNIIGSVFNITTEKSIEKITNKLQEILTNINNSFLVIDDLERCSFDKSTLLGILNRYVEHGGARVLLIANTEAVEGDENKKFNEFREKIIGQSFEIPAGSDTAIMTFISDIKNTKIREIINRNANLIIKLHQLSKIDNLRVVRRYLWLLKEIISSMNDEYIENPELLQNTIIQAFVFYVEFKLNLGEAGSNLTPLDIIPNEKVHGEDARFLYAHPLGINEEPSPIQKVVKKYGLGFGIHSVITLKQWSNIMRTGLIDKDQLNADLAQSHEMNGPDNWPSWKRLWHLSDWDFSNGSTTEFDRDIADLEQSLADGRYKDPREYMHVIGVVLYLSKNGLIKGTPSDWTKKLNNYTDRVIMPNLDQQRYDAMPRKFDSEYDGRGYLESPEFEVVLQHMRIGAEKWLDDWLQNSLQQYF